MPPSIKIAVKGAAFGVARSRTDRIDEDDDAPPRHRELIVAESRRVVDLIVGWARARERTFSADDVKQWDDWLDAGLRLAARGGCAAPRAVSQGGTRPTAQGRRIVLS